jgi:hypothetical protein
VMPIFGSHQCVRFRYVFVHLCSCSLTSRHWFGSMIKKLLSRSQGAFGHRDFSIMAVNNSTFWCILDVHYELMAVMC